MHSFCVLATAALKHRAPGQGSTCGGAALTCMPSRSVTSSGAVGRRAGSCCRHCPISVASSWGPSSGTVMGGMSLPTGISQVAISHRHTPAPTAVRWRQKACSARCCPLAVPAAGLRHAQAAGQAAAGAHQRSRRRHCSCTAAPGAPVRMACPWRALRAGAAAADCRGSPASHASRGAHSALPGRVHLWGAPAEGADVLGGHVGGQGGAVVPGQRLGQPHICAAQSDVPGAHQRSCAGPG